MALVGYHSDDEGGLPGCLCFRHGEPITEFFTLASLSDSKSVPPTNVKVIILEEGCASGGGG